MTEAAADAVAPDSAPRGGIPPALPALGAVQDRLAGLAGFAASDVLRNRLLRAAPLLARLPLDRPGIEHPDWAALLDAVTVQETRMFRAASQIEAFRHEVLPQLASGPAPLRLVSAGCATGEEAWTLAILAAGTGSDWRVEGLDLCRPALEAASAARYRLGPPDALREMPVADRAWLDIAEGWFEPVAALRPNTVFRRANLLDPVLPDAAADAILCRNVLIYMTEDGRQTVLRRLVAALRPGGALLLGATDSPPRDIGLRPWSRDLVGIWRREGAA
ncbi:CheR family methyltransferase [Falsiroseomonas selenitidurans]|uniref:Methyltransferase domain-containing protein n=1 Tax=Falsiroseomonas selenitidurans TaxID=2716335 RepID=A0ABX1E0N2_9PROT|nr:CheR family methyltransferase [Falsiroseomonas selenitidurans]NKC30709.1 methyltransferase domain-containing protein [Falsiroseomonas selenitidurans]